MDDQDYRRAALALGIIALVLFLGILAVAAMAAGEEARAGEISGDYAMRNSMDEAQGTIQKDLSGMDSVVTNGASGIGQTGLSGDQALVLLSGMSSSGPAAIDAVTSNLNGTIVAVQPDQYKSVIGADIYNQTHIKRLYEEKVPVMSDLFMTVEGFPAVDIASPVISPDGKFIGATTLLINPATLIGRDMPKDNGEPSLDVWVMQKDGTLLFSSNVEHVGKNVFNDPGFKKYPYLVNVSGNITTDWQGSVIDMSTDMQGKSLTRHIIWTTVGIRGTEWRLVFSRVVDGPPSVSDIFNPTFDQ